MTLTRKPNGDNLIDLGQDLKIQPLMTKVSVLETFDPLLSLDVDEVDEEEIYNNTKMKTKHTNDDMPDNETIYSNDSSFYEAYDPFEYLVDKTQRQVLEEEEENIYATIAEKGLKIDFTKKKLFRRNLISRKKYDIFS